MMCYTPKWLWDAWEGGLVRMLSRGLNQGLVPDKDKEKKKKVLIDYLLQHVEVRVNIIRFTCRKLRQAF